MDLTHYIDHPEQLGKESLYLLRQEVAQHPYYHAARLLFVQNLFLLRDPSFGEELRRAALFLPDRRVLYEMVEGPMDQTAQPAAQPTTPADTAMGTSRTQLLIDDFLETLPPDVLPTARPQNTRESAADYTAVLMSLADAEGNESPKASNSSDGRKQHRSKLLDDFMETSGEHFELKEQPEFKPELDDEVSASDAEDGIFTETLACIYTKQGRYDKAAQIIRRIYLNNPKKSAYFADQLRFLEKLKLLEEYAKRQKTNEIQ